MRLDVQVAFDEDQRVWYVLESDVPGLHAEAASFDDLVDVIDDVVPDLLRTNLPVVASARSAQLDIRVSRAVDLDTRPAA